MDLLLGFLIVQRVNGDMIDQSEPPMDILPKLSPAQNLLLRTAARRSDGRVIPPSTMRGGARIKVLTALLQRGWIEPTDGGHSLTDAGYAAIGLQRPAPPDDAQLVDAIDDPTPPFTKQTIYKMLHNRMYLGEIVHKGQSYPGQHQAIITQAQWDAVHALIATDGIERRRETNDRQSEPVLLRGLLFTSDGERLVPSYTIKKGKTYRY
jgi:Recombinase